MTFAFLIVVLVDVVFDVMRLDEMRWIGIHPL